jgi:hypothetical protein
MEFNYSQYIKRFWQKAESVQLKYFTNFLAIKPHPSILAQILLYSCPSHAFIATNFIYSPSSQVAITNIFIIREKEV